MKRIGNLWEQLTSFPNLLDAARKAAAGKKSRPDVAAFLLDLEPNLLALRRELIDGVYLPGPYRTFLVREPKQRQISAAPFRDRVVHHALTGILEPIFERRFSPYSFACRKGFGVHKALCVARNAAAHYPFVLKCDIRKYFAAIDHQILLAKLERGIKCKPTLQLAALIVERSNPQEEVVHYFPGDDLFSPFERRRGLPLGNQTSQFFANLYLNSLDHFIVRELRPAAYARYVDDFLLFSDSKDALWRMHERISRALEMDRLCLHPNKSRVYTASEGVSFLGWRIFPNRVRLIRSNVVRFSRRMRSLRHEWVDGRIGWESVRQSVQAWIGHASFGDTTVLRERVFARCPFPPSGRTSHCAGRVVQQ